MSDEMIQSADIEVESQSGDESSQFVEEATSQGWVPKEKFRGNEEDWVDAKTFVERGKEINPILRQNNERLKRELEQLRNQLEDTNISVKEFKKFQEEVMERKIQEYETQIKDLKTAKKEAIAVGDGERVVDIDDQIDQLKEAQRQAKDTPKEVERPKAQPTQEFLEWQEENSWYKENRDMQEEADLIGEALFKKGVIGQQLLKEVSTRIKRMYPEQFVSRKSPVEDTPHGRGNPSSAKKKRTYENLPADAKAACDDFVSRGFITKEQYVQSYDWE